MIKDYLAEEEIHKGIKKLGMTSFLKMIKIKMG